MKDYKQFLTALTKLISYKSVIDKPTDDAPFGKEIKNALNYFLDLDGENNISLGCDFDGITSLPVGVKSIYDLTFLYTEIEKVFGSNVAKKIFYENAYNFMSKNLK